MNSKHGYLMIFGFAITSSNYLVSARSCIGGHTCSPPKECCAQGCCYLYAPPSASRTPSQNTSQMLNLFFINHWFFWCIIFAIVIAILCACSLWKKRRQICDWSSSRTHSQSLDSAGSCYAPPQYSRCNSFYHAPPPYTEVTSKPDLYPIVFSCNSENSKNGSSYLMVQYFRNYIVRPTAGSLSATSTVDSLSSSFICNVNEANTLVPPPYSRAASPDLPLTIHDYSSMPRSVSQQECSSQQHPANRMHLMPNSMHAGDGLSSARYSFRSDSNRDVYVHTADDIQSDLENDDIRSGVSMPMNALRGPRNRFLLNASPTESTDVHSIVSRPTVRSSTQVSIETTSDIGAAPNSMTVENEAIWKNLTEQTISNSQRRVASSNQLLQRSHDLPSGNFSEESPVNGELLKKYGSMRSYINSITGSAVSSLANIDSPASPPQATSPTAEIKELLEQIRQLQNSTNERNYFDENQEPNISLTETTDATAATSHTNSSVEANNKRPSTLQQNRRVTHRSRFFPMSTATKNLRSPIGAAGILNFGRTRKNWTSKSAPTTPGTSMPSRFLDDDSPLLNEHDEDIEPTA